MRPVEDVDYILNQYTGGGHWWQWKITLIMYPMALASGFPVFLHIFGAYESPHRCAVHVCDTSDVWSMNHSYLEFALPKEHASNNLFTEADEYDPCRMYNFTGSPEWKSRPPLQSGLRDGQCVEINFDQNTTVKCESYVYNKEFFRNTLTMELNLVCDEEYKRRLLGTLMMLGLLVGSVIGGRLGDSYGRKKMLFLANLVVVPAVGFGGILVNYEFYAFFRFLSAACLPVMWITSSAYSLEIFSQENRRIIASVKDIPFSMFVFCIFIYFFRDWQHLHFAIAATSSIGLLAFFFVPESPRWLLMHDRKEEAMKIFLDMAATNKRTLTDKQLEHINKIISGIEKSATRDNNLTPLDMFHKNNYVKTLIIMFAWIMACLGYYGLTLNATKLNGDPVKNFLYATLSDCPVGVFLFLALDRIGRRWTTVLSFVTLGLSCLGLAFVPKHHTSIILAVYLVGKAASGSAVNMVWMYTNELYPTNLRNQAVGFNSMVSRVFCMTTSFIGSLATFWQPLPMLLLGTSTILAGLLSIYLPETSGRDLPQTMQEAEALDQQDSTPEDSGPGQDQEHPT